MFTIEYEDSPEGIEHIIHNYSERTSLCGWRGGIEYDAWNDLMGPPEESELTGRERATLLKLVDKHGVWWRWSRSDPGKVKVPIAEWRADFERVANKRKGDSDG